MIKKDMMIGEILEQNPEAAQVMAKHGLHCIGCHIGVYESLADGCKAHGMEDEQVELLVKEINELIEKDDKKEA